MIASYNSHDKEKEQCHLFFIVLNLGLLSKLSNYHCSNFICCTYALALHLSIVGRDEDAFAICINKQLLLL